MSDQEKFEMILKKHKAETDLWIDNLFQILTDIITDAMEIGIDINSEDISTAILELPYKSLQDFKDQANKMIPDE